MHSDRDNFESLRRLLTLKKYEQPPAGYFNRFSQQVIARIQAEAMPKRTSFLHWLNSSVARLRQAWDSLENRPALAGAFGFAVCGVLASGLYFSPASPLMSSTVTIDSARGLAFMPDSYHATNSLPQTRSTSIFDTFRSGNLAASAQMVNWQR